MKNKLTQNEIDNIQKLFSDFIKMDGPDHPFPLLAEGIFKIFEAHYDTVEPILDELVKKEYALKQFGGYFPLLVDVTSLNTDEINSLRNKLGKSRYLSDPFALFEKTYLVCKEFYLNNKKSRGANKIRLYKWFCELYDIDMRADILDFSKSEAEIQSPSTNSSTSTSGLNNNTNKSIENTEYIYSQEIEKLNMILKCASLVLYGFEKDNIIELIKTYKNGDEINETLKKKVDETIDRIKTIKEQLSHIEF